jgi:DNA-binding response OmpR family regulator
MRYLPILMLTTLQAPQLQATAFERGADDYITKPFEVGELLARVQVWGRAARRVRELLVDAYHVAPDLEHAPRHKAIRSYEDDQVPDVVGYVVDIAKSLPPDGPASEDGGSAEDAVERAEPESHS